MKQLPLAARIYVSAVIAAGGGLLLFGLPRVTFHQPLLFLTLVVLATLTAALKVTLPLTTSGSTMSVSYAVDFATLLLLGKDPTMYVATVSAWSQCTFKMKTRNPPYRTLFSMACLFSTVFHDVWRPALIVCGVAAATCTNDGPDDGAIQPFRPGHIRRLSPRGRHRAPHGTGPAPTSGAEPPVAPLRRPPRQGRQ